MYSYADLSVFQCRLDSTVLIWKRPRGKGRVNNAAFSIWYSTAAYDTLLLYQVRIVLFSMRIVKFLQMLT
jgi:hypothetical protein